MKSTSPDQRHIEQNRRSDQKGAQNSAETQLGSKHNAHPRNEKQHQEHTNARAPNPHAHMPTARENAKRRQKREEKKKCSEGKEKLTNT